MMTDRGEEGGGAVRLFLNCFLVLHFHWCQIGSERVRFGQVWSDGRGALLALLLSLRLSTSTSLVNVSTCLGWLGFGLLALVAGFASGYPLGIDSLGD